MEIQRLAIAKLVRARETFTLMADVFGEGAGQLSDQYLRRVLARSDFWALAAVVDDRPVGGLTAHALPMTNRESTELFIYDVAVASAYRRRGVGRALIEALRAQGASVGIDVVFVAADNEDVHAVDFYRALGGALQPVSIFTWQSMPRQSGAAT